MAATYDEDPALYIFTSLTAGSSHIITATSRLETILRANKVPFKAVDVSTDDKARMLWGRRAKKDESGRARKFPGLVQRGEVLGDIVEIEEWNEYGELKMHVQIYYDEFTQPSISQKPKTPPPKPSTTMKPTAFTQSAASGKEAPIAPTIPKAPRPAATSSIPVRPAAGSVADEAAKKAKEMQLKTLREKVYGPGGKKEEEKKETKPDSKEAESEENDEPEDDSDDDSEDDSDSDEDSSTSAAKAAAVTPTKKRAPPNSEAAVQSPNSGTWKARRRSSAASSDSEQLRSMLQSPRSTSWKPTDVEKPVTTLAGAVIADVSSDEIAAIEKEQAIAEEPEPEDEEDAAAAKAKAKVKTKAKAKSSDIKPASEDKKKKASSTSRPDPKGKERVIEKKVVDKKVAEKKVVEKKAIEKKTMEKKVAERRVAEKKPAEKKAVAGKAVEKKEVKATTTIKKKADIVKDKTTTPVKKKVEAAKDKEKENEKPKRVSSATQGTASSRAKAAK